MVQKLVSDLAQQMDIKLSGVNIVEGRRLGCTDSHLLNLSANGKKVSTLVQITELNELKNGSSRDRLEAKIRSALIRLK